MNGYVPKTSCIFYLLSYGVRLKDQLSVFGIEKTLIVGLISFRNDKVYLD